MATRSRPVPTSLIALCTDRGFLVPSIVVADQIRRQRHERPPDIILYLNDFSDTEIYQLEPVARSIGVKLAPVAPQLLEVDSSFTRFFQRGISTTALMRLAIAELLPADYDHIIYLDGDMQVIGDLQRLLDMTPPANMIAAAPEAYPILKNEQGKPNPWLVDYLANLGLQSPDQYFNSGLLSFRLETWRRIAPLALDFFLNKPELCPNYDQSALNAVVGGAWAPLHPAYNWHTYFHRLAGPGDFQKRIVHFTSRPKPWQDGEHVWHPAYLRPYRDMVKRFPMLARYIALRVDSRPGDYASYYRGKVSGLVKFRRYRRWLRDYVERTSFVLNG